MKELRTEIEIQAAPKKVWQILTDLDKWIEWNPFIHRAIGKAKAGEKCVTDVCDRARISGLDTGHHALDVVTVIRFAA